MLDSSNTSKSKFPYSKNYSKNSQTPVKQRTLTPDEIQNQLDDVASNMKETLKLSKKLQINESVNEIINNLEFEEKMKMDNHRNRGSILDMDFLNENKRSFPKVEKKKKIKSRKSNLSDLPKRSQSNISIRDFGS